MDFIGFDKEVDEDEDNSQEDQDFYGYGNNTDEHFSMNATVSTSFAPPKGVTNAKARTFLHAPKDQLTVGMVQAIDPPHANQNPQTKPTTTTTTQNLPPVPVSTTADEQKRVENQRKADQLRAKLLAQRQNTPNKAPSRVDTPVKSSSTMNPNKDDKFPQNQILSDPMRPEKSREEGLTAAPQAKELIATKNSDLNATEQIHPPINNKTTEEKPEQPKWSNKLTDAYYADLPIWLEMTGYHDVEYRGSKLQTYKERKELEQQAAKIQERLAKLQTEEQANIGALRANLAHPTPASAPALPAVMPSAEAASTVQQIATPATNNTKFTTIATNGTKRTHSPEPVHASKVRRDNATPDFRFRGANDSPTMAGARGRPRSPGTAGRALERRISYPDARRRSFEDSRFGGGRQDPSRDPSLERRQAYYRREQGPPTPAPPYNRDRYDRGMPPSLGYENHGRMGYSSVNDRRPNVGAGGGGRHEAYPQGYRGSAGMDLGKGGKSHLR